jgi:hypothetical protein
MGLFSASFFVKKKKLDRGSKKVFGELQFLQIFTVLVACP